MRYGSLFSGVGGFDLGFDRAGMECAWQSEIDKQCQQLLASKWGVPIIDDVRKVHSNTYLDDLVKTWYHPLCGDNYTEKELIMAGKLKKLTPEQAAESVRMYDRGLSCGVIGEYFGVSRQAMWDLLRRRTTMRSGKRYGEENHFYRNGNVADDHAQNVTEYAVRKGVLNRKEVCELCGEVPPKMKNGRTGIQAHHCDYNKPLEVMWLCQKCHHQWHKTNTAIAKEVQKELEQVNLICGGFP